MENSAWTTPELETAPDPRTPSRVAAAVPADKAGMATFTLGSLEEDLVEDARAGLTPAQMVERKLVSLLKSNPMPVSHLMTGKRSIRAR